MDKAGETQAIEAKIKRKVLARKETASSVPEQTLLKPGPAPFNDATEAPHRPDTAPAEIGSLPGDRYPTPQPEDVHHTKSRRKGKKRRSRQEDQETPKLQQPLGPPPDNVDQKNELDGTKVASPKISGDGSNPPEGDIIDLTIKEESPPMTPTLPTQVLGLNESASGFIKAGWVRPRVFRFVVLSDKKSGLVPAFERHIMLHRCQEVVLDRRRGD